MAVCAKKKKRKKWIIHFTQPPRRATTSFVEHFQASAAHKRADRRGSYFSTRLGSTFNFGNSSPTKCHDRNVLFTSIKCRTSESLWRRQQGRLIVKNRQRTSQRNTSILQLVLMATIVDWTFEGREGIEGYRVKNLKVASDTSMLRQGYWPRNISCDQLNINFLWWLHFSFFFSSCAINSRTFPVNFSYEISRYFAVSIFLT